jgi:hypothetical protein
MKPTAYVLLLIGVVLAGTAALLSSTPNLDASAGADGPGPPSSPSALRVALLVAAGGAIALACLMLRYGGSGYIATASPRRR